MQSGEESESCLGVESPPSAVNRFQGLEESPRSALVERGVAFLIWHS